MNPVQVAIATLIVSSGLAYYLAKKYGDVAGTKAAIEFEKEKAAKARIAALQSLLNEVIRIRDLAHHNSTLVHDSHSIQSVVRMPVTAFETAFLSGESSLLDLLDEGNSDSDEEFVSVGTPGLRSVSKPLASVTAYLTEAYSINALVDIYLGLVRGLSSTEKARRADAINQIIDKSQGLSEILDQLEKHLRHKLGGKN